MLYPHTTRQHIKIINKYSCDELEIPIENILNLVGFIVGLTIGIISFIGFRNTGSPTLFRLSIAFFAIGIGFCVIWIGFTVADNNPDGISGQIKNWMQTLGIGIQTIGYFFIAFSHSLKAFLPKSRYFRSVMIFPLFLVSSIHIAHILRSVSFILLVYAAIETMMSYFENKRKGTIIISVGLAMLALGEFLSWYSLVFPESILYFISNIIKIGGLIALFIPISRIPLTRIKIDDIVDDEDMDKSLDLGSDEAESSEMDK